MVQAVQHMVQTMLDMVDHLLTLNRTISSTWIWKKHCLTLWKIRKCYARMQAYRNTLYVKCLRSQQCSRLSHATTCRHWQGFTVVPSVQLLGRLVHLGKVGSGLHCISHVMQDWRGDSCLTCLAVNVTVKMMTFQGCTS